MRNGKGRRFKTSNGGNQRALWLNYLPTSEERQELQYPQLIPRT